MSSKLKILNLIDLYKYQKDVIWGKNYFAQIENDRVVASILYGKYLEAKKVLELHHFDSNNETLIKNFILHFSLKEDIHYFICKLSELEQAQEIAFLREQGFLRLTREYLFEYQDFKTIRLDNVDVLCHSASSKNIKAMIQVCKNSQPIEFRDYLFHYPSFFRTRLNDTYVFYLANAPKHILGYACKLNFEKNIFEFVLPPAHAEYFMDFLLAFVDTYVHFEKNENFQFIVNENVKDILEEIQKKFTLKLVKQILIHEAQAKDKVHLLEKWGNKIQIPMPNGQITNKSKTMDFTESQD